LRLDPLPAGPGAWSIDEMRTRRPRR